MITPSSWNLADAFCSVGLLQISKPESSASTTCHDCHPLVVDQVIEVEEPAPSAFQLSSFEMPPHP